MHPPACSVIKGSNEAGDIFLEFLLLANNVPYYKSCQRVIEYLIGEKCQIYYRLTGLIRMDVEPKFLS